MKATIDWAVDIVWKLYQNPTKGIESWIAEGNIASSWSPIMNPTKGIERSIPQPLPLEPIKTGTQQRELKVQKIKQFFVKEIPRTQQRELKA